MKPRTLRRRLNTVLLQWFLLLVVGFLMVLVTLSGSLWFNGLHAYSGL